MFALWITYLVVALTIIHFVDKHEEHTRMTRMGQER